MLEEKSSTFHSGTLKSKYFQKLKIHRWRQRAGSSPATGTILCGHLGEQGGLRNTPDKSGVFLVFSLIC